MELTPLRQFLAIAEHGSMSAAARALDVRQPTLSAAIKNLEDELEATLFLRDSRGVTLTASGRALRSAAQGMLEVLERAKTEISGLETEDVGAFVVGCHASLGAYFLPDFLQHFMTTAPGIGVSVLNSSSQGVRDGVLDRSVDFGLVVNPESHPDLVMVELFRDGIELYVSAAEPERLQLMQALLRVRKGPLIAATRIPQVRDLVARLQADNALPDRIIDAGDLQLVRSLAAGGMGVALLPRRVAQQSGFVGRLRRLHKELPGFPDTIYMLYRADLHRTRASLRLKDALVQHGRGLRVSDPHEDSILPP